MNAKQEDEAVFWCGLLTSVLFEKLETGELLTLRVRHRYNATKEMVMTTRKQINSFGRRLVREYSPKKVILFGSYANGHPNADSDVDILVVMPFEGHPVDRQVDMRMKLRPEFPIDLLVRSPSKIRERLEKGDDFIKNILDHGVVLHEAHDA